MKKVLRVVCRITSISALLTPILCIVISTNALGQAVGENQYLWQTNASGNDVHVVDVSTRTVVKRQDRWGAAGCLMLCVLLPSPAAPS